MEKSCLSEITQGPSRGAGKGKPKACRGANGRLSRNHQYQKGVIEDDEWERHENIVRMQIQGYQYSKLMWQYHQKTFTPEFQELVNSFLSD